MLLSVTLRVAVPIVLVALVLGGPDPVAAQSTTFAVLGDFGDAPRNAADQGNTDVSTMIDGWNPNAVLTVGDNNYGSASQWNTYVGAFYGQYIEDPTPGTPDERTAGAGANRFFPALGNHDWDAGLTSYTDYFVLPTSASGGERYYDLVRGDVHFFIFDSDGREPDDDTGGSGAPANATATAASTQGQWLRNGLAASTSSWNVVLMHHAPYSSSASHGSQPYLQLPYGDWGADLVLSGHDHNYERLVENGTTYIVTGAGGHDLDSFETNPVAGSLVRNNGDYGALRLEADAGALTLDYFTRDGTRVDTVTLGGAPGPTVHTATFQQGVGGYTGTVDTYIQEAAPNADHGSDISLNVDSLDGSSNSGLRAQALLRFDDLLASQGGALPDDAVVVSATLELHTTNAGDGAEFHRLLQAWQPGGANATWAKWGDGAGSNNVGGVQTDGVEVLASRLARVHTPESASGGGHVLLDVTESVVAWQADPSSDFGWLLDDVGTDGWDFDSSEGAFAPRLSVQYYTIPLGDMDGNGVVNAADVPLFVQALTDRPAYNAAFPLLDAERIGDVNGDGAFDLGDVGAFKNLLGASASGQAVPEPAMASLLAIGGILLLSGRRHSISSMH